MPSPSPQPSSPSATALATAPASRWHLLAAAALAALAPSAGAQTEPAAPAPAPARPADQKPEATQLKPVEVTGRRASEVDERRQSTASKIIIGRDEIEKFGDSTVGEILKRLPGVTMQGAPGRGGQPRMRGLGSGYTQLLIDGERVPPGFSFDSLLPEQIERIEVLRAPTAETGARAIAGTINVITRGGYRKRINDLKLTLGIENGRTQPGLSWSRNDALGELIYNFSLSANHTERETDGRSRTDGVSLLTGTPTLAQRETSRSLEQRDSLHATGRLQWRAGEGLTVMLMPLFIASQGGSERSSTFVQTLAPPPQPGDVPRYDTTTGSTDGRFTLTRLNGQATQRLGTIGPYGSSGGDLELRAGFGQARWKSTSLRDYRRDGVADPVRELIDRVDNRDTNLTASVKLTRSLGASEQAEGSDGHRVVVGAEVEANRRREAPISLQDGVLQLADFGGEIEARATRIAAYAQDEWSITPNWAAHVGLRWEGIRTQSNATDLAPGADNRSGVLSPLLHAVYKPDPKGRDQVRFSLTRSYRPPTLQNLVARPSLSRVSNSPTHPDRAGNPNLKPELATGLDVAFERYVAGNGLFSANLFHRQISNYLRSVTSTETVSWASEKRSVSRVQNVGDAVTQGIELEAKFRLSDLWPEAPKLDVRANASAFRSRVKQVPGPDNRLDQQPGATANLGGDYRFTGMPLSIGGNLNWTPGYTTRISATETAIQGRKLVADAYAAWVFSPTLQLRLSASNLGAQDYLTGSTLDADGVRETALNTQPSYLSWQLRLEMKL